MIMPIFIISYNENVICNAKKLIMSLNISPIFHQNLSSAGAALNGNLAYLYLPNWHVNMMIFVQFQIMEA